MQIKLSPKIAKESAEFQSIMDSAKQDSLYYMVETHLNATNESRGGVTGSKRSDRFSKINSKYPIK